MIISKKKYEKLNNDLVEAKAKVDDAKKALDDENKIMKVNLLIKEQRDDYKTQRDTLIDDIAVLRANNERLERENEQKTKVINLYKKAYEKTHKGWFRYRELTNHIRAMKFASPYSYNYIHLVNFIKDLERADDER